MWVRKRIDLSWVDLNYALMHCGLPANSHREEIQANWSSSGDSMVCLSVRSGLDLLLQSLKLPPGSEVLMSALTIEGMIRVVREHGLVPVPVDVDIDTLSPRLDSLERAITPRSRLLIVAHLFGGRVNLNPIRQLTDAHNLMLVEDCAQAFDGAPNGQLPVADCSLYSFGPIKTSTALGGAMVHCQDRQLIGRMRELESQYPEQSRWSYLQRVLKYGALMGISNRWAFTIMTRSFQRAGKIYDHFLRKAVRGFREEGFLERLRKRPSKPLLSLLQRRIDRFDEPRMTKHSRRGAWLTEQLPDSIVCPGYASSRNNYWVFPIMVDDPGPLVDRLRQSGFDAMQYGSMVAVPAPAGRPELEADTARHILAKTVFLPLYHQMPRASLLRMAYLLNSVLAE